MSIFNNFSRLSKEFKLGLVITGIVAIALLVVIALIITFGNTDNRSQADSLEKAALADYWAGTAEWKLVKRISTSEVNNLFGGQLIQPNPNTGKWYLFTWGDIKSGSCPKMGYRAGYSVSESSDKGLTWTKATPLVFPTQNPNDPMSCAVVDGDVFFDASTKTWKFLFQCLAVNPGPWQGCYAEIRGADNPANGTLTFPYQNPVIRAGELWRKICDNMSDDCVSINGAPPSEEGTFDIFHFDGSYYYISFHGAYSSNKKIPGTSEPMVYGYRGIAKTRDFSPGSYIAGDPSKGVPKDAIFDKYDAINPASPWREGWGYEVIGGGAGSIIREDNYFYSVIEIADATLNCFKGQKWDFGLYRTSDLTSTNWEGFPLGNPILYNSSNKDVSQCNPAYAKIFKDATTDEYYLSYTIFTTLDELGTSVILKKLVKTNNLIKNADFWKCTVDDWDRYSSQGVTNWVLVRNYEESSDYNCHLVTNCGGNCAGEHLISQGFNLDGRSFGKMNVNVKLASVAGSTFAEVIVGQYNSSGQLINISSVEASNIETNYKLYKIENVPVNENAVSGRFWLKLKDSNSTIRIDEVLVQPIIRTASVTSLPTPTQVVQTQAPTLSPTAVVQTQPPQVVVTEYVPLQSRTDGVAIGGGNYKCPSGQFQKRTTDKKCYYCNVGDTPDRSRWLCTKATIVNTPTSAPITPTNSGSELNFTLNTSVFNYKIEPTGVKNQRRVEFNVPKSSFAGNPTQVQFILDTDADFMSGDYGMRLLGPLAGFNTLQSGKSYPYYVYNPEKTTSNFGWVDYAYNEDARNADKKFTITKIKGFEDSVSVRIVFILTLEDGSPLINKDLKVLFYGESGSTMNTLNLPGRPEITCSYSDCYGSKNIQVGTIKIND